MTEKIIGRCVVKPCRLVEVCRGIKRFCCLHCQADECHSTICRKTGVTKVMIIKTTNLSTPMYTILYDKTADSKHL